MTLRATDIRNRGNLVQWYPLLPVDFHWILLGGDMGRINRYNLKLLPHILSTNLDAESPAPWATLAARAFAVGPGPGFQSMCAVEKNLILGWILFGNKSELITNKLALCWFFSSTPAGSSNCCVPHVFKQRPGKSLPPTLWQRMWLETFDKQNSIYTSILFMRVPWIVWQAWPFLIGLPHWDIYCKSVLRNTTAKGILHGSTETSLQAQTIEPLGL